MARFAIATWTVAISNAHALARMAGLFSVSAVISPKNENLLLELASAFHDKHRCEKHETTRADADNRPGFGNCQMALREFRFCCACDRTATDF
jgi:hypothetical protein